MVVLSILVTNIVVVEIEEEDTEMANSSSQNCSIVEVVDMEDNRVQVVVKSFDMLVGPQVAKESSQMFQIHPHSYRWITTQERMGSYLLDALLYRCDIQRCCLMDIPFEDVWFYILDKICSLFLVLHLALYWLVKHLVENSFLLRYQF